MENGEHLEKFAKIIVSIMTRAAAERFDSISNSRLTLKMYGVESGTMTPELEKTTKEILTDCISSSIGSFFASLDGYDTLSEEMDITINGQSIKSGDLQARLFGDSDWINKYGNK